MSPAEPERARSALTERRLAALTQGYQPLPGVYDEMMDADGRVRGHWSKLLTWFATLGPDVLAHGFQAADRHLRDSGVFYRVYDDPAGGERSWPLAHVPLVIDPEEWKALEKGVIQRARLAEAVLADAYGPGDLVSQKVLPAAVIAGSPEYLRPLVGVAPPGGRHLRSYAIDVGRGPNGKWWVLSDRTQAPSGAGYALENRIALSRALPNVYRAMNVERLASFFQAFRNELANLNSRAEARVSLLSPGPLNETYFEHAYLARYLGFLLVEGEDLTVRDGAVYVRTVSGLRRVDVLWRRLDSDFADPLELRGASRLGVPGLVQAVREGNVVVANGLGSGVVESRALMGFMPALARHILGTDLLLPNIATWWCGQAREQRIVLDNLEKLVFAPAFEARMPGMPDRSVVLGSSLTPDERTALAERIRRRGVDIVGQEAVKLSTMPVWINGRLQPRPFILRLFVVATGEDDWTVMPGGFCRVSDDLDARAVSLQSRAKAADVWVLGSGPVAETSLLPKSDTVKIRRTIGTLPSRAADNLFWLGRYLERSETALRVVRSLLSRAVEQSGDGAVAQGLVQMLAQAGALTVSERKGSNVRLAIQAISDQKAYGALPRLTRSARYAAAVIRDRLAPDAFQCVTDLAQQFETIEGRRLTASDAFDEVRRALRLINAFSGLAAENMNRLIGWRFLELGRRIERAAATLRFVQRFAVEPLSQSALDVMLELGDSQITYRSRYVMTTSRTPVIDLLTFDDSNPRSVAFQVARLVADLETLPAAHVDGRPSEPVRAARRILADLLTTRAEDVELDMLADVEAQLYDLSDAVMVRFFSHRAAPRAEPSFAAQTDDIA
ncbi:circularly permuted type 2 ATP-grasp protein [Methylobrevis albus]|uniref:Circularly permuted type 2 ATP-grasp protein n=1 Tax=Methylobrevis albus TaxID=2793297 RepID=A0A931MXY5_9HYPH|nr:circularly permuted type 2 ATP-grasp protein [Methylobrevis albus]MBH0237802.1 circularly permuted type 2 ATP-grasp protein [Methylobrevis albus]